MSTGQVAFDQRRYRQVLGHFCTGVTVITAVGEAGPIGFACQSFAALSIDPPLVLFCPGRTSRSWPVIEKAGTFCVNLLAEHQSEISARFGAPSKDKFSGLPLYATPQGNPIIDGALTWIDCTVHEVREGGDHLIVLGHVEHLGPASDGKPLLFNRGSYTGLTGQPAEPAPVDLELDSFLRLPSSTDWL
ncbi:3-hydroxy-9,10-secoandrosta-1,3,5(10)-triene-9,17-dione monooxygenase reductase subunit [Sciscionella marina]|uniref:3-hydroxy-9,10-secoandrosta-1,3,5(10)-triene-9, 17-dione monooxygenase reductase subunit n=1 Tax=Sciscionella marina TaxID=508770 RepID=UPI000382A8FE|nr:3-hydroxy-9,10-secoandrosta-1,3,5(10)-triene-9,17-dione monooxygenase reductase subunit [Sciscionella marina]